MRFRIVTDDVPGVRMRVSVPAHLAGLGQTHTEQPTYTVKPGDTLSKIAWDIFKRPRRNSEWQRLCSLNNDVLLAAQKSRRKISMDAVTANCDIIFPGLVLRIPTEWVPQDTTETTTDPFQPPPKKKKKRGLLLGLAATAAALLTLGACVTNPATGGRRLHPALVALADVGTAIGCAEAMAALDQAGHGEYNEKVDSLCKGTRQAYRVEIPRATPLDPGPPLMEICELVDGSDEDVLRETPEGDIKTTRTLIVCYKSLPQLLGLTE